MAHMNTQTYKPTNAKSSHNYSILALTSKEKPPTPFHYQPNFFSLNALFPDMRHSTSKKEQTQPRSSRKGKREDEDR